MDITIIGTGNMARGIGTRMLEGGNHVHFVGDEPGDGEALANELENVASDGSVSWSDDRLQGDVVVLAVPFSAAMSVVQQYSDQLGGKVIVDITNPVNFETMDPAVEPGTSGAEEIAKKAPSDSRVVKAFNTTFAGTLEEGEVSGHRLDVLIAGDDASAKSMVARMVESGGMRALDAGPLKRARQLEALGLLHMALQSKMDTEFASAVKFLA